MGNDVLQTMSLFAKMVKKPIAAGCCILLSVIGSLPCVAADAYASKSARTDLEKKIDCHLLEERKKVDGQKNQNLPVTTLVEVRISCSDVAAISNAVLRFGGKVIDAYGRYRCVNARIPVAAVESLAAESGVTHVRKMPRGKPNKVNTSEGVSAHLVDEVRSTYGLTGKGVKIGVLSDSVDYLDDVQSMGDLPSVTVLDDDEGDGEGTAMLEIVHDVAPDAELYFATANKSVESFAENIRALADAGCKVIVDDYTYPNEPAFQDGIIAQAVADVTARGCLFFTSAANSGSLKMGASGTFEGDFVDTDGDGYMNFPDGKNYIELSKCAHWRVTLQWSDPWGASDNDYDLEIEWPDGTKSSGCDTQDGNDNPYEEIYRCCAGECNGAKIKVKKYSGEPRYIRIDTHRGRLTGGTAGNVYGHNASETAFSIGAASAQENESPFTNRAVMEDYSSDGPRRMFYAANGNPLTPGNLLASGGQILQKPDVVAADDVSCYTPSYDERGNLLFTPFCGTSASAPHAAAIAALMLEKKSDLTREQLLEAWKSTSWRIDGPSWNACSGHGIINAKAAVQYVVDNFCSGDSTLANDNFANATALEGISGSVNATNVGATKEEGEPATYAGSPSTKTVWWTWTPTEDCKVTFSTEGSNFDTVLAVYTGDSLSSLDEVDSSDDYAQGIQWSKVAFSAVAGVTYRVVVGGYGGNEGQIQLCWEKSLEQDGTCYGLFVGINNFQFGWQDTLPGCIADVNNLSSALIDGAAWTDQTVTRLTNAAATKSAVRQKVGELAQTAQSGDTVLIYFSTHGGAEEDATYARVCLYGEDERYFDYELADDLAAFKSGVNVIMLLDTCSAAGMFKTDGSRVRKVSMAERVNAILEARNRTKGSKGKIDASEIGWLVSVDYDQEASGGDEGGSPFTSYCLVNPGLDDEEADLDGDGNISFQELYYFAYRSYCRNRQETPQALNVNVLRRVAAKGAIDYVAPAKPLYTVTFDAGEYALDFDEEYVIQDVEEGSAAVEPEVEGLEGFFYEWDRDFSCVMGDLAVSAEWDLVEDDPLEADFGGTKLTFARLGAPAWEIDDEDPIVLRSGTPDDGGMSVLKLTVQVEQASAKVSFKHKTSSEYRYDLLVVLLEDANAEEVSRASTSGVAQDWTDANITFPALGRYSISWVYMKDFEGDSAGDDCAYLKDFQLEGCTPVNDPIPQQQVAKPVLNPSGTTFTDSLTVTCSCSTGGATIRYTTDNSSVTESSDVWPSGGLKLTETTTVRAKAFKAGMDPSEEASQTYTKETSLEPVKAVSKFTMNGHQAVVCGVIGATADSFKSTDGFGNTRCLVDSRIVDAEKTAGWNNDTYWCTALSQMDMLVWLGWAQDAGYSDVDALADFFRANPELLCTKGATISDEPIYNESTSFYNAFGWFQDQHDLDLDGELFSRSGLSRVFDAGAGLMQLDLDCDCTSKPWLIPSWSWCGHSVVCCGYAYDESQPESDPSSLKGIFIIDSDNDKEVAGGAENAPNSISYYPVQWVEEEDGWGCYLIENVWDGRDGYVYVDKYNDVLYAKPGYTPVGVKVGDDPLPPPPVDKVATPVLDPAKATSFTDLLTVTCSCDTDGAIVRYTTDGSSVTESSLEWPSGGLKLTETTTVRAKAFKAGMDPSEEASQTYTKEEPKVAVSKFTMDGHQAVVCGVIGATADSFKSTDNCGNPCLIDIRIIDAEKSAEWVDDNYWCTALSQMDMLVWLGWAKDIGYEDEDALANYFRKNPSLLRTKPSDISGWPSEGQYGYNGVFDWFADQTGGQTLDVQSGSIGSSFLQVLQNSLQGGDALVRMDVVSDCTSNPWLSHGGEISHSVICCGYALDPAVSSTSPSALVGLFLIDSDNDQYAGAGGTSAPNSISYVSARWNGSRYDFTNVWGGRDGYADWSCVYDVLHAKPGYTPVGVKVGNDPTPPPSVDRVATPVLDPPSNMTFKTSLAVKCTCPTEGATIRFATNETDVITESFPVWADLTLTATTVIRVKAFKANMQASDEVKCVYTLDPEGGEQGNSSLWTDPVIDVGKKDRTEATAATTYTGWLHDSKGNLTASFTMKVGKANKNGIAKVTLTVTDLATGIKSKYTGNYNVEEGEIEGGQLDGLALGEDGVVGKIGKETLTGGRMVNKTEAAAVDAVYKNRIFAFAFQNTAGKNVKGAATFTAKFSSKGKAKISGTLMDGTKVSTSAQLIVGDKACALPISFTKKGKANFGLVLWFNEKKATFKEATGLTECTLGDGVTDVKVEFVGCDEVDGTMAKAKALEVDGKKVADIAANGTKWVATAAKDFEDAKPKVTYAAKKGTITGTYKATVKGAAKPVSAKITGVWLGKTGVGTAVMKVNKVVTALPVVVK